MSLNLSFQSWRTASILIFLTTAAANTFWVDARRQGEQMTDWLWASATNSWLIPIFIFVLVLASILQVGSLSGFYSGRFKLSFQQVPGPVPGHTTGEGKIQDANLGVLIHSLLVSWLPLFTYRFPDKPSRIFSCHTTQRLITINRVKKMLSK